eukprot:Hpha_TRINITY_DN5187_c0_g2::TRINITY_DN5187_c0_g2_i1::g.192867::m.192867
MIRGPGDIPHEPALTTVLVEDVEAFLPAERLHWQLAVGHPHRTGGFRRWGKEEPGVKFFGRRPKPEQLRDWASVLQAVYSRYSVVISIVFPSLVRIAADGDVMYDRACIAVARLITTLANQPKGPDDQPQSIRLTVLIQQVDYTVVDVLVQDCVLSEQGSAAVVQEVLQRLKAAEARACETSKELRSKQCGQDANYNPFLRGSLLDVVEVMAQRHILRNPSSAPRDSKEASIGQPVLCLVADFATADSKQWCSPAVLNAVRERCALLDAQLALFDIS